MIHQSFLFAGRVRHVSILAAVSFFLYSAALAEVQTTLTMTAPDLVAGNSSTFSASQASGPVGTNGGTFLHSYAGVNELVQTSGTGRFASFNGATRYGVGFDTFQFFQSFISGNYLTVLSSGTTCPASTTYNWIMVRLRTPDAPRLPMDLSSIATNIGGTMTFDSGTSVFTGTNYFNLVGPTLSTSVTYGLTGLSGATCSSGDYLTSRTGSSSLDRYNYVFFGANSLAIVSAGGNPQVIVGAPQVSINSSTMTSLADYVFTGLYTAFASATSQTRNNIYLYPDSLGTTWTLRTATSLTDPSSFTNLGTLTCDSLDSPTTGFCSGTLTLQGVSGTGKAACLISTNSTENLMVCTAQYPSDTRLPVTILAKTVKQAVLQVALNKSVATTTGPSLTDTYTATVTNLTSRYLPTLGNPGDPLLQLSTPWSNTNAFGGGNGTCGTTLKGYATCTFVVTYSPSSYGVQTQTLRVNYDNGVATPNATASLIGAAGLSSLAVSPSSTSVASSTTNSLTGTARFSDGSTQDITSLVSWASSNASVGTVDSSGLASWLTTGSTTVTASFSSVSGNSLFTVFSIPSAVAVYSVRKLYSSYVGNAMKVRRSSDNTTQDIAYTASKDLDTTSLLSFCAATSCYVDTWYDQSGNSRNATQATTAKQPRIVNAGSLDTKNSRPSLIFSGGQNLSSTLTVNQLLSGGSDLTVLWVAQQSSQTASSIFSNTTGTDRVNVHASWSDGSTYFDVGVCCGTTRINAASNWTSGLFRGTVRRSGAQMNYWRNGTSVASRSDASGTSAATNSIFIGAQATASNYYDGAISEFIFVNGGLSTTDRTNLEATQFQYFSAPSVSSIAISPTLTYVPQNTTQSLSATATLADGSTLSISSLGSWSSSNPTVATITATGSVSWLSAGATTITCTYNGVSGTATVNVVALPSAAAAYGLRKLYWTYSGNAIKVRRTSDNTTQDIGFSGNALDNTSLLSFCSATSCHIDTWYDQSGNSRNATQATTGSQPRIVNAGTIDTANSLPTMVFSGAQNLVSAMTVNQALGSSTDLTALFVIRQNSQTNSSLFSNTTTSPRINLHSAWGDGSTYFDVGAPSGTTRLNVAGTWTGALASGSVRRSGANMDIWKNGTNIATRSDASGTCTATNAIYFGSQDASNNYFNGNITELIFFNSGISANNRVAIEANQRAYFSTP